MSYSKRLQQELEDTGAVLQQGWKLLDDPRYDPESGVATAGSEGVGAGHPGTDLPMTIYDGQDVEETPRGPRQEPERLIGDLSSPDPSGE
jgi:hypothetical protein